MKFIPILFSTPMVQALLAGSKTMTRRIMKMQPGEGEYYEQLDEKEWAYISHGGMSGPYTCPYGHPGDVLWVREAACKTPDTGYAYKASMDTESEDLRQDYLKAGAAWAKWKPGIHMPKTACRLFLEITNVRAERLHDINEADAKAEGVVYYDDCGDYKNYLYNDKNGDDIGVLSAEQSFKTLWHKINGEESWDANPWVWVIEFKQIERPANFLV